MKKGLVIILLIISNLNHLKCADNYDIGDILYVWAKSGLNVRVGPGTDSHIIAKIPFGESVLIWGKTDRTYNVKGIDTMNLYPVPNLKVEPIIFKGNWVQIQTLDGQVGYVIDQYLLLYKPKERLNYTELKIDLISIDTLIHESIPYGAEGLSFKSQRKYDYGITETVTKGGVWYRATYSLPEMTIEEALVFLSSSLNDFSEVQLVKNWKEEVIFSAEICTYTIKKLKGRVTVEYECSC